MSRYIDADAMKEWLDEYLSVFKKYDKSEVKGFVEHQPSIEIVRCAECKWFDADENESDSWHLCTRHFGKHINFAEDDFCSYGERKTKQTEREGE